MSWSVGTALTASGHDSVLARLAEWARNHGMSAVVNLAERVQYSLNPPRVGGAPHGGLPRAAAPSVMPSPAAVVPHTVAPAAIPPIVNPPLSGEGQWQTVETVHGYPAIRVAYLRPDSLHTSYLTGVAWMDPKLVSFALHPGTQQPGGGPWTIPSDIPPTARQGLLAVFNGGFKLVDSHGGVYLQGRTVGTLTPGDASFVIYKNGTATIGAWGSSVSMTPNVVAVRQNLALIVNNGAPVAGLNSNVQQRWGYTLGNNLYVWRSGVGVTRTGAIVYAAGNALSAQTLADVLARAGAVRAMELDINPYWVSYMYYTPDPAIPGGVLPHKLDSDQQRSAYRYFVTDSRDFFTVYAR